MKKFTIHVLMLISLLATQTAIAQNTNIIQHNLNYSADSIDMWGGLGATSLPLLNFDRNLLDISLGENGTSDPSFTQALGTTALGLNLDFDLQMYLNSTLRMHGFTGGYVDLNYPVTVTLDFPDDHSFYHGETVQIHTNYGLQNGWYLRTHFPTHGNVNLDFQYGFGVDLVATVQENGTTVTTPTHLIPQTQYPATPAIATPVPHDSISVINLDSETREFLYPWVNEATGDSQFYSGTYGAGDELSITIPDGIGTGISANISIPNVETTQRMQGQYIYAEGQDDWFTMDWNLLDFIRFIGQSARQASIDNVVNALDGGTSNFDIYDDYVLTLEYYILHGDIDLTMSLVQEFSFCPTIEATMRLATPLPYAEKTRAGALVQEGVSDIIPFTVNNDIYIKYPCHGWDSLQVFDVTYNIRSNFTNHTYHNFSVNNDIQAVHINVSVPGMDNATRPVSEPRNPEIGELADLNNETPNPRKGNDGLRNISFCFPTNCGSYINETDTDADLFEVIDHEWEITFPANQYNMTRPGTWLKPNPEIKLQVTTTNVTCFGGNSGSITATALSGAPNFVWDYSNGITNEHAGNVDQMDVVSGYYYITLTDQFDCVAVGEANVLESSSAMESVIRADNILCKGLTTGNLYVTVYGGVPPYTYTWSNGSTEQNPQGVPAGVYTVNIVDALGCTHANQVIVSEPTSEVEILDASYNDVSCNGLSDGSIGITVVGGTPAYSYSWSNNQQVQNLFDIAAGTYRVTVTDANGCSTTGAYSVTEPSALNT
ncbi:MAG: SprB repeat-containing protein, partial [Bacteroidales bacterium]|nr:SprB repeat-containing protein [Bacteroidales bacterium]